MKNNDFEEINDMLGNVVGGTSEQGLFQFSFDTAEADTVSCSELCFTNCSGRGSVAGTKKGTITIDPDTNP